jgi:hypothetical protein
VSFIEKLNIPGHWLCGRLPSAQAQSITAKDH